MRPWTFWILVAFMLGSCGGETRRDAGPDAPDAADLQDPDVEGDGDVPVDGPDGDSASEPDAADLPVDPDLETDMIPTEGIHVALSGADTDDCGRSTAPCRTVGKGMDRASAGENVLVHAGTYEESWIELKSDVALYSADGLLAAKIYSGDRSAVRFDGVSNALFDGFEVYGNLNGGEAGDGLIRVLDSSGITIRNGMFHDAPADQDVVKVSGRVHGLLLENLVVFNPAERVGVNPCGAGAWYQENIDIFGSGAAEGDPPPVSNVVVRGCWLFHTDAGGDWLIYSKINTENVLYENNVFGPSAGGGCGNAAVGIGTGEAGQPDASAPVVTRAIVRNNIFSGLKGDGALAVMNSVDVWVYSNVFYENSGALTRSVIMTRGNSHAVENLQVFGNVFLDNNPSKSGAVFYWERDPLAGTFFHDFNLYLNNISASDVDYHAEASSLFSLDPQLAAAAVPDISAPSPALLLPIAAGFEPASGSPVTDRGPDAVARESHPNWLPGVTDRRWDIAGAARPPADTWDMGAHEISP
jgi:hypothetical protein